MQILPSIQSARYLIEPLGIDGITHVGDLTGISNALDADTLWGEGDAEFIANCQGNVIDYNPIPTVGEWCEMDVMYGYNDGIVICRQSHYRVDFTPEETPALWLFYQAEAGAVEWIAGEQVYIGTERTYDSVLYVCIQAHVTQFTPDTTPALWNVQPSGEEWQAGVAYTIGDVVTYDALEYECRQSHTSQVGWEPPNVPALWLLL